MQDGSTDFEFLPIDVSLARCQRYFRRIKSGNANAGGIVGLGVQTTTSNAYIYTSVSPPMRVTPTLTFTDLICSDSVSFDSSATLSGPVDGTGDSIYYNVSFAVSGAINRPVNLRATSNTSGRLDMSSEL